MKTWKANFFVLFVFILSASILFDGASHSSKCLTDKFEEIPPTLSSESSLVFFVKSIKNVVKKQQEFNFLQPISGKNTVSFSTSSFIDKLTAFLHLFQLF
jgi:hypothetical protein